MSTKKTASKAASGTIRWASLMHAAGAAKNILALLDDLKKKSAREEADEQLRDLLVSKGRAFSASGPALTQLLLLAAQKKLKLRASFVELAIWVLALGDTDAIDGTGLDLGSPKLSKRYRSAEAKGVIEAAMAAANVVVGLVDDEEAAVRAAAAHFLGLLPTVEGAVVEALGARLAFEREEGVQLSLVLALGVIGRNVAEQRTTALGCISAFRKKKELGLLARGGAALAAALASRGLAKDIGPEDLSLLFQGMGPFSAQFEPTSNDHSFGQTVSWGRGRVDLLAIHGLRLDEAAHAVVIRALALALRVTSLWNTLDEEWTNLVLAAAGLRKRDLLTDPLAAKDLTELQRTLLVDLSQHPSEGSFEKYGIPPDVRSRRRFLGLDGPSVMERELPFGSPRQSLPLWRIARTVVDEFGRKNRRVNVAMQPEKLLSYARQSVLSTLSEADWLDLWLELKRGAYGCSNVYIHVVRAAIDASNPVDRAAFAERWAGEIRRHPEMLPVSYHVFYALAKDLGPDESYPREYEDIFTFFGLDEDLPSLFAKIAPARREEIAFREIDRHYRFARSILDFAELAPKAAAAIRERDRQEESGSGTEPDVADEEPETGSPRYRFRRTASSSFADLRASSPASRRQVVHTLEMRNGDSFHDFEACATAVPRMFDVSEEELELEHYDITQEGDDKPSYEMWVYLGEHGIVFEVGSKEPTSVHCVEGHFWSVDDDDLVAVMLAKALDHASPF